MPVRVTGVPLGPQDASWSPPAHVMSCLRTWHARSSQLGGSCEGLPLILQGLVSSFGSVLGRGCHASDLRIGWLITRSKGIELVLLDHASSFFSHTKYLTTQTSFRLVSIDIDSGIERDCMKMIETLSTNTCIDGESISYDEPSPFESSSLWRDVCMLALG